MPELPEVEVTRRGIEPRLAGERLTGAVMRVPALRYPLPAELGRRLAGAELVSVARRGKYLLLDFGSGHLLLHLGMSGSLRLVPAESAPEKHDHVDLVFGATALRLRDPRRFGALLWIEGDPADHPLLASLGVEPLASAFTAAWLAERLSGRKTAIKPALMDAHLVVGIGNIYASESLFLAGIDPRRAAGRIADERLGRLVPAIRKILRAAIAAGGSSLRDFSHSDGELGCFQTRHRVYDRAGQPCTNCGTPIKAIRQGQRSTFFCPRCQR
ncbi:MAG: bifunctional DNA-formamidopyrimidine glycosylase/DNA-(apurinic or apyrimidinic site) lyase [Rhodocyclaceae bacterium]|jgi:formamidopyrimidine-DNA glycosylase|nr:bifunctional DNA-formamidopyrimidine glycosylase/DNA-(apurinic or apyrimidinic site) lyase [Rhodocyclaceae bacterium]